MLNVWGFFQVDLIERGVCTETKAQQVMNEQCLPLVGERQSNFEKHLEEMDVSVMLLSSHMANVMVAMVIV